MDPAVCPYPLLRSSLAVILLTQGICTTLRKIPVHQDQFARIVESVLIKYYEQCEQRFFALTNVNVEEDGMHETDGNSDCLSATWAQNIAIKKILVQNSNFLGGGRNGDRDEDLSEQETKLEMDLKKERAFHRGELIFDVKTLWSLANMHYGMDWFVEQVWKLRTMSLASLTNLGSSEVMNDKWYNVDPISLGPNAQEVALALEPAMAQSYDNLLQKFERLGERCLFTLRIEFRCHAMYYLDLAMREGSYFLDAEPEDPDPFVLGLNSDLMKADELMSAGLPPRRVRFLFDGLASLMTQILIKDYKYIRRMNENGVKKLARNVKALQQCLSNINGRYEARFEDVSQFLAKAVAEREVQ
jgi:exocyst complex component 4